MGWRLSIKKIECSLKNLIFRGGESSQENQVGAWTVHRFKRGVGKKEVGGIFEGGGEVDTPMQTMDTTSILTYSNLCKHSFKKTYGWCFLFS